MNIKGKLIRLGYYLTLCPLIKRSQWYKDLFVDFGHDRYPDNEWYRKNATRNYEIVALGSSSAKWAFDFANTGIKAMNWANQPQTLLEDYNLLRTYHSILTKGGVVLITVMPFTGLNKETGIMDALKYLRLNSQGEPIQPKMVREANKFMNYPILFRKQAIKGLLKYLLKKERPEGRFDYAMVDRNQMDYDQLENDAAQWIKGWMAQFDIKEWEAPLTEKNQKAREYRVGLMRQLVDFCLERGYRPVYIIPPVTEHLSKYYTPKFSEIYIDSYLKQVDRNIELFDYSSCKEFKDDSLYFNSFFLNKRGRKIFTERVLCDLMVVQQSGR